MTTKSRFTTAIATGAVLLNALAPVALAGNDNGLSVVGNGAYSTNNITVNNASATVVNQTNTANITNNVNSTASTGGNNAGFNTGGDVRIVTGDAKTKVDVSNAANLNVANVENCGGCGSSYDVKIKGNGAYSENDVELNKANTVFVNQDNDADIENNIEAESNTGKNAADFNTGGDVVIVTGDAKTSVDVANKANANFARIGGGNGDHDGSSVRIVENGAFSVNDVELNEASAIVLAQNNDADIENNVDADAKTGKNDANFSTGGEVAISTGDAKTKVEVDNLVNFNSASIDCDCVLGELDVKVKGNGAFSENDVEANAANELFNDQNNDADIENDVEGDAKTGYNAAEFSTGAYDGDPLIWTGDAENGTQVSSYGNVNVFNNGSSVHLPGDWELGVEWDLEDLLGFLHGWN